MEKLLEKIESIKVTLLKEEVEDIFGSIAEGLFNNYCIKKREINGVESRYVEYHFLEVKFYYFCPEHQDIVDAKDGKKPFVYKRKCDKAGMFFIHDSGVDICFKGVVCDDVEKSHGGGILIRTLLRVEEDETGSKKYMVVTGPWDCRAALFNYTDGEHFPIITKMGKAKGVKLKRAKRQNDKSVFKDRNYCFYCNDDADNWCHNDKILERYNPETKGIKSQYAAKPWNRKYKVAYDS